MAPDVALKELSRVRGTSFSACAGDEPLFRRSTVTLLKQDAENPTAEIKGPHGGAAFTRRASELSD
jgi:hypothetical protein